jgi:hypothetical protein
MVNLRNTAPKIQAAGIRHTEARHLDVIARELVYGDNKSGSTVYLTRRLRTHLELFRRSHLALRYGDADWKVVSYFPRVDIKSRRFTMTLYILHTGVEHRGFYGCRY